MIAPRLSLKFQGTPDEAQLGLRLDDFLLPLTLGSLRHQALFQGARGDANVTDFAVHKRLHPLQVREEPALGNRGHVSADTAGLFRLTTTPDDAALDRAFAG